MANYNAGFPYFEEPEFNTRPPLYPFILTPITALQHLGVSPKDLLTLAHFFALIFSFAFYSIKLFNPETTIDPRISGLGGFVADDSAWFSGLFF